MEQIYFFSLISLETATCWSTNQVRRTTGIEFIAYNRSKGGDVETLCAAAKPIEESAGQRPACAAREQEK